MLDWILFGIKKLSKIEIRAEYRGFMLKFIKWKSFPLISQPQIEPGSQEIKVQVTITYEIK